MDMKNLPNMLTAFRIGMVPLLVFFMFIPFAWAQWMALFIFALAAITDFFDGYLARKHNVQSDLGALLDPIADKFLVLAALLMLIAVGTLSGFNVIAAIIILGREILVAGLREFLAGSSVKLPVTLLAKCKTTIQMVSIGFLVVGPAGSTLIPGSRPHRAFRAVGRRNHHCHYRVPICPAGLLKNDRKTSNLCSSFDRCNTEFIRANNR